MHIYFILYVLLVYLYVDMRTLRFNTLTFRCKTKTPRPIAPVLVTSPELQFHEFELAMIVREFYICPNRQ